jgi:hypothetical protein
MDIIHDPYLRHLFDGDLLFNVYNQEVTNLSVGAPGPDLLKHCAEMLNRSTQHRLVRSIFDIPDIRIVATILAQ